MTDERAGRPRGGAVARGRALAVADHALTSVGNVAITVVAARELGRDEFGGFAVAFAAYVFVVGVGRALVTEPLLVRPTDQPRAPAAAAAGAMALVGIAAGVLCGAAGLLVGGPAGRSLATLALFLPLLCVQDSWRYLGFAAERPAVAVVVDAVWLAALALGVALLLAGGGDDPAAFVAVWAAAGSLAAVAGAVHARALPRFGPGRAWIGENRQLGGPFLAEFLASGGSAYAVLWALGAISGLAAVGAVRVAQTVLGPLNVLYLGVYVVLIPHGVRASAGGHQSLRRTMVRASVVLAALSAVYTALAVVLPESLGRSWFGGSWDRAAPLLLPLGAAACLGALATGATAGLRALGAAREGLLTRLTTIPTALALPLAGGVLADEEGFAAGVALAAVLTLVLWWLAFHRAAARRDIGPRDDAGDPGLPGLRGPNAVQSPVTAPAPGTGG